MEILIAILPAIIVCGTAYLIIKNYFDHQTRLRQYDALTQARQQYQPLKLQAYERLILLCERIAIDALLRRTTEATTAATAYFTMIYTINAEFEHNTTQQMYVPQPIWRTLIDAKSQTLQIITTAYNQLQPTDPPQLLEQKIIEQLLQATTIHQQIALQYLRTEAAAIIN